MKRMTEDLTVDLKPEEVRVEGMPFTGTWFR